jgi:hypothetical protein
MGCSGVRVLFWCVKLGLGTDASTSARVTGHCRATSDFTAPMNESAFRLQVPYLIDHTG